MYGGQYFYENLVRIKKYYLDNRDRIQDYYSEFNDKVTVSKICYFNNRYNTVVTFRLILFTKKRILEALRGELKSSYIVDILGLDIDTYRKWIEYQMTPEMNWLNIEIDQIGVISLFDVSGEEELQEVCYWKNTQHLPKGIISRIILNLIC